MTNAAKAPIRSSDDPRARLDFSRELPLFEHDAIAGVQKGCR